MIERRTGVRSHMRVLIYSHDTFGLGHLRRCRAIAHALVEHNKDLSVLILTGSPIIGSFDFRARVDFVRIPGVIKLRNGDYTSLSLLIDIEETLAMRQSVIHHTADIFDPDLFIVDKEPLGLRGEVKHTLEMLKDRGVPLILGLRDVMDEPGLLAPEWERKNVLPALRDLYDDIWVYGLPQICDPLTGINLPRSVRQKMTYTGYLQRSLPTKPTAPTPLSKISEPFILVTTGGGGDGEAIIDWVLRAYETDTGLPYPALLVLGPFMHSDRQAEFLLRASRLKRVEAITFDAQLESLMARAIGVVAMGGYNTFCEILSFNRRALLVPRVVPRQEQMIRALKAQEAGLLGVLPIDHYPDTDLMIEALSRLPRQKPPSAGGVAGLLDGLDRIDGRVANILRERQSAPLAQAAALS